MDNNIVSPGYIKTNDVLVGSRHCERALCRICALI